jgi:DNA-binding CsgD family transcriptional regulator
MIKLINSLKPICYPELKALFDTLSRREKEVLKLIVGGNSVTEIAAKLFLSDKTVHAHRRNIIHKTDMKNSVLLVAQAVKCGEY